MTFLLKIVINDEFGDHKEEFLTANNIFLQYSKHHMKFEVEMNADCCSPEEHIIPFLTRTKTGIQSSKDH